MEIGAYIRLFGRPGSDPAPPSWASVRAAALAAEAAGFDLVALEDGALYPDDDGNFGLWEAMTIAAGIAAATTSIGIAHAVINSPYRHPTLVARCAVTLDEISGGRYRLGIGLGNTPEDYPRFGIEADRRFSRFAEAIEIMHGLLREGRTAFSGEFYRAPDAELVLRGPRPSGIPIIIAAAKPKMLELACRYADEWNWWHVLDDEDGEASLTQLISDLEAACRRTGRDPETLRRSLDVYSIDAAAVDAEATAARILAYREAGFDSIRCSIRPAAGQSVADAMAAMADVVRIVHEG